MKSLVLLLLIFNSVSVLFSQRLETFGMTGSIFKHLDTMYRKPSAKELQILAVEKELLQENRHFLNAKNTGIFRLVPDLGCNENKNVVTASEICLKYSMPGNGSGFSFRKGYHRIWRMSDLIYKENLFVTGSRYTLGIIGNLGDIELSKISLSAEVVKSLDDFSVANEYKAIENQYGKLSNGMILNNVFFSNRTRIAENSTYLLRSVAYRTKSFVVAGVGGTYNEFEFDKRIDTLIAFKVLKIDGDGSVIILWKKLREKESPKLKFEQKES